MDDDLRLDTIDMYVTKNGDPPFTMVHTTRAEQTYDLQRNEELMPVAQLAIRLALVIGEDNHAIYKHVYRLHDLATLQFFMSSSGWDVIFNSDEALYEFVQGHGFDIDVRSIVKKCKEEHT